MRFLKAVVLSLLLVTPVFAQAVTGVVIVGSNMTMPTLSQIGCIPIDATNSTTITNTVTDTGPGCVVRENCRKINEFIDNLATGGVSNTQHSGFSGFIVDNDYAIADDDGDDVGINWPKVLGGTIASPGGQNNMYFYRGGDQGEFIQNRLFWSGDAGDTMMVYRGAGACFQLNLLGRWLDADSAAYTACLAAHNHAGTLLRCENLDISTAAPHPHGCHMTLSMSGVLADRGVYFPHATNGTYEDSVYCPELYFSSVQQTYYHIEEIQSLGHLIGRINCDGTLVTRMFLLGNGSASAGGGGDVEVQFAYHPNGIMIETGPSWAFSGASLNIHGFKLDSNFYNPSVKTLVCNSPFQAARLRISGSYGITTQTHQMFDILQNSGGAQPDIQCDIKGQNKAQRAAMPVRRFPGDRYRADAVFPASNTSSTKLWVKAYDNTGSSPAGIEDGTAITTLNDFSAANNDVSGGVTPIYVENSSNWNPAWKMYTGTIGASSPRYLINATPTDLDDNLNSFTISCVLFEPESGYSTSSPFNSHTFDKYQCIISCTDNPANADGFALFIELQTGKVMLRCKGTDFKSSNAISLNRPNYITVTRDGTTGTVRLRVNGVITTPAAGATGALAAANGPLMLGALPNTGSAIFDYPVVGELSELIIDDVYTNFTETNEAFIPPGSAGGTPWSAEAYRNLNHFRAMYNVW